MIESNWGYAMQNKNQLSALLCVRMLIKATTGLKQ